MQSLYETYNQLMNGARLDASTPKQTGIPFWDSYFAGLSAGNRIQNNSRDKKNTARMQEEAEQFKQAHMPNGQTQNTLAGAWGNPNGVVFAGRQTVQPSNFSMEGTGGTNWDQLLGRDGSGVGIGNFQETSSDNPQAQAGEVQTSPKTLEEALSRLATAKYLQDNYEREKWLADDAASGVSNPLIAMERYNRMVAPLREEARKDRVKQLFSISSNPDYDGTDMQKQARIMLAGEIGNADFLNELAWKNKQRQWAGEERPYKLQGLKLSNDLKNFRLMAAQGLGMNLPQNMMMDDDGFIVGGNPYGQTNSRKTKGSPFGNNPRKQLLDSSSALGAIGKQIAEAQEKLKNPDLSEEERKKISDGLDGDKGIKAKFKEAQKKYIESLTPYLYTKRFGGNGYDGLADLYLLMKTKDKSGLDSMALSDSIAQAARGVVTNGEVDINDIQKEILDRANMRQNISQFDDIGDTDYGDFYGYEGVDTGDTQLNSLASPQERLGQVQRLRDQGREFARNDAKYGMYNNNLKGYYGWTPPESRMQPQTTLTIIGEKGVGRKGALPPINKTSVTDPMQRVRGGGWGAGLKKKEQEINNSQSDFGNALGYGHPFVDRMRALQGWYPFRWNDGTNCMRAISTALEGTPYGMSANGGKPLYNVDQAIAIAKELGQLRDPRTYTPRAGDIVVTNYSDTTGHVGMVTENGGVIQNGSSGDEVEANITDKYGRRNGSVYETNIPVNQLHDDIAYYISTSDYLS